MCVHRYLRPTKAVVRGHGVEAEEALEIREQAVVFHPDEEDAHSGNLQEENVIVIEVSEGNYLLGQRNEVCGVKLVEFLRQGGGVGADRDKSSHEKREQQRPKPFPHTPSFAGGLHER